jgi:hypothetical protein
MPALFAYVFAILVLLGGGYAGLQWLAEPLPVTSHSAAVGGKAPPKSKNLAEKSEPPYTGTDRPSSEPGSSASGAPSKPSAEAAAKPAPADDPGKPGKGAETLTEKVPAEKDAAKEVGDIPRGGCMPFGVTGQGELVFPMECRAVLTRNWDGQTPRQPNSDATASATNQSETAKQTETAASPEAAPSRPTSAPPPTQNEAPRTERDANAKIADAPANPGVGMTSEKERAETHVGKTTKATKRASQPARPRGVMMVLRTIEFPDGHREQRLMSMDHWRRTEFRSSDQW